MYIISLRLIHFSFNFRDTYQIGDEKYMFSLIHSVIHIVIPCFQKLVAHSNLLFRQEIFRYVNPLSKINIVV
jgi:hypothetical protein